MFWMVGFSNNLADGTFSRGRDIDTKVGLDQYHVQPQINSYWLMIALGGYTCMTRINKHGYIHEKLGALTKSLADGTLFLDR